MNNNQFLKNQLEKVDPVLKPTHKIGSPNSKRHRIQVEEWNMTEQEVLLDMMGIMPSGFLSHIEGLQLCRFHEVKILRQATYA